MWWNGTYSNLDTLGSIESTARSVNSAGQIVGERRDQSGQLRAFVWQDDLGMVDLDTLLPANSGWTLGSAASINDRGQIVGWAYATGGTRAFLLNPVGSAPDLSIVQPDPILGTIAHTGIDPVNLTLTVTPAADWLFLGWTINPTRRVLPQFGPGNVASWANPLTVSPRNDTTIAAVFVLRPHFDDVDSTHTNYDAAIEQLTARGLLAGYTPADCAARGLGSRCFDPAGHLKRAQVAAILLRAIGRAQEAQTNQFDDRGGLDEALWDNVSTFAYYGFAHGYSDTQFGPNDDVSVIQAIAFITRLMNLRGHWGYAMDTGAYPTMTNPLHRLDLVTYASHVGSVPGMTDASTADDWNAPATRDWFAAALWAALDQHFGTDHVDWAREQPTTAPSAMRDSNHRAALVAALGPIWATEQRNVTGWRRRRVAGNVPG